MKPSERIKKAFDEAELEWIREYRNEDHKVKPSAAAGMMSALNEIAEILNEIKEE